MSANGRRNLFFVSALVLATLFFLVYRQFPPVGTGPKTYGDLVDSVAVPERHVTDVVNAVTYDIRGFDTLGEEFILFTAVAGVLLLLRKEHGEPRIPCQDHLASRAVPRPSDAVRVTALIITGPILVFGLYVVTHGQLTPGGGFQGGVILSSAPLLAYLAGSFGGFQEIAPERIVSLAEAVGAGGYVAVGFAGLIVGGAYLQNVLPIGKLGSILSGGTVALIDLTVGLEVGCGLLLLMTAILTKTLTAKPS